MKNTSDIFWLVQLVISKFLQILPLGFHKILGLMSISNYMACQPLFRHSKELMSISYKKQMSLNRFMTLHKLMKNLTPNIGKKNSQLSKKLSSSKPSDLIKLSLPSRTGLLRKWVKDSLYLLPLISTNAIRTLLFKHPWFLCCQLVQIQLLISSSLLNNQEWVKELNQFHWVKVKERKPTIWQSKILKKEVGFYCKTVTWLWVGCLI